MPKEAKNIQIKELEDSRKGTIFFLKGLEFDTIPSFNLGLTGKFIVNTEPLSDLMAGCEFIVSKTPLASSVVFEKTNAVINTVKGYIAKFFEAILDKAKAMFGEALIGVEWLGEFAAWGIQNLTGTLANLIPCWGYVRSAADMYSAIKSAVTSTINLISQCWSGYGVSLLKGTPSIIADSLAVHSAAGALGGVKDLALKSLEVGLEAGGDIAGGAGSLISLITDILERIFQLVMLCIQKYRLNKTVKEAQDVWNDNVDSLSNNDFMKWFTYTSVVTPIIPSLVMNSGYVANPIRFLSLFGVIQQSEFDKGVKHIEKLRGLSKDYINDYAASYKLKFSNKDAVSNALLSKCYN